jgi:Cys-tRNA synthase (O-phospho-L-seryl-tRNA:Cys-tRNA synthase)
MQQLCPLAVQEWCFLEFRSPSFSIVADQHEVGKYFLYKFNAPLRKSSGMDFDTMQTLKSLVA